MIKERNISIDILKCLAALIITNSHMEILYHPYEYLATGGAIGDGLFFFCSGFTLFLGRMGRFDNWYKRRINRIYPTVFVWAFFAALLFGKNWNMTDIVFRGGGWFVSCIMIYYILLYPIRRFLLDSIKWVFAFVLLVSLIWYFVIDRPLGYNMYGNNYFKWCFFFIFMLSGAYMGLHYDKMKVNCISNSLKFITFTILFYVIFILTRKFDTIKDLQFLSLFMLLGVVIYMFKLCNCKKIKNLYKNKWLGGAITLIGSLCLEIYLIQGSLFTDKMNSIFPLNIIIMFVIILIAAYILRCFSRWFSQTFDKQRDYNYKEIFKTGY